MTKTTLKKAATHEDGSTFWMGWADSYEICLAFIPGEGYRLSAEGYEPFSTGWHATPVGATAEGRKLLEGVHAMAMAEAAAEMEAEAANERALEDRGWEEHAAFDRWEQEQGLLSMADYAYYYG